MLYSANILKGCAIQAQDGQIGKVDEFYFDDGSWHIRYLVVDVGNWLKRQRVLLIPEVVTAVDPEGNIIDVTLTKDEVANSPDALEQLPVSRQIEVALHQYYNWTPYWDVDPVGVAGFGHGPVTLVRPGDGVKADMDVALDAQGVLTADSEIPDSDLVAAKELKPSGRLQSTAEVRGYHIHALDGEIGHIADFFVRGTLSEICYLVVDTRNWLPGKRVVMPPNFVHAIRWDGSKVEVALTREEIKNAPEYVEDNLPFVAHGFETELEEYYARPFSYGR